MPFTTGDNNYAPAKWIVNKTAGLGTHTSIASALSSASSGDTIFIMPNTYTENLTLVAGVNLVAYTADAFTPNVTIVGKCSASFSGTCTISGVQLQTNSDYFLSITGANATIVNLFNCYFNCTNNTGINNSGSNSSSQIAITNCNGSLGTTGIAYYSISNGTFTCSHTLHNNSGGSTTANTFSGGAVNLRYCYLANPVTLSGSTAQINSNNNYYALSGLNTTALNMNSTAGSCSCYGDYFETGSATAISVGASATLQVLMCGINSTNASATSGSGSLRYGLLGIASAGTLGVLSTTTLGDGGMFGKQNANAPAVGYIGEIITSVQSTLTSFNVNTITNTATLTPAKGVWEVSGNLLFNWATGVGVTAYEGCIATANNNFVPIDNFGNNVSPGNITLLASAASGAPNMNLGPCRWYGDGSTAINLNCYFAATSAGTLQYRAAFKAVRVA